MLREMAEKWFGYGSWEAPYWFLGPEPGGDDVHGPALAWAELRKGSGELLDCKAHRIRMYSLPHSSISIAADVALFDSLAPSILGRGHREGLATCVSGGRLGSRGRRNLRNEPSSCAAKSLRHDQPLRLHAVESRIATLRLRIAEYRPTFILMYSTGPIYRKAWEKIAPFHGADICRVEDTVAMITPSPAAYRYTDADWIGVARKLKTRCIAEGLAPLMRSRLSP